MSGSTEPQPTNRWILHFTHVDNLARIVHSGRLSCDATARHGLTCQDVGDHDVKELRHRRRVPVGPGGCVGDYVPFYFGPQSPMMFRIACDHRDGADGRYAGGDRPLVYLATTVGAIVDAGLPWVATDGNAATETTEFTTDLTRLNAMVDWPLMRERYWPTRRPKTGQAVRVAVRPTWYYGYERR